MLVTRKMVEKNTFIANPNHQYCVSQCGEHECSVNNIENGDYFEYPSLSYFTDEY